MYISFWPQNTLVRAKFPEVETDLYTGFKREFYQIKLDCANTIVLQKFSIQRGRGL